jgi:uncharacterized protein YlxW (UPF0749 family)
MIKVNGQSYDVQELAQKEPARLEAYIVGLQNKVNTLNANHTKLKALIARFRGFRGKKDTYNASKVETEIYDLIDGKQGVTQGELLR